jgi:branched-chain amino acid transport system permease protein
MSPKKSDPPPSEPPSPPSPPPARHAHPWRDTLLSNVPLPLLLGTVVFAGWFVEDSGWIDAYYARMLMLIGYNVILAVSLQLINGFSGQFSLGHAGFMAVGAYLAAYPAMTSADTFANPAGVMLFYMVLALFVAIAGGALYGIFTLCRLSRRIHSALPAVLMIVIAAWFMIDFSRAASHPTTPPYLIWSRAIDLLKSLTSVALTHGQPAAARLSAALPAATRGPICFLVLLIGAGCCAAATGLIVGLPALRLRGDYLAIATLGMGEIIRIIIINTPALGGALGLTPIPRYANFAWIYGAAVVTIFVVWRIAYSALGRAIMAVREDEIAAAAVGINTTYHKVLAFVIGAFFAGVAGALFALDQYSITPTRFTMDRSIEIVVMVTLGGLGSISGAILAAVVLTLLPELLRPIAEYRMIIYSLALIIIMLVRPQGLLGGRELWPRRWRRAVRPPTMKTSEKPCEPVPT